MTQPKLPTFSFSFSTPSGSVTTDMGRIIGHAGATLMDAATESIDNLDTPHALITMENPWHARMYSDNTLLIAKHDTLFPVPLKVTSYPTHTDLLDIATALDTALTNITFKTPAQLGGCLSHMDNKNGTHVTWWMPGAALDPTSLTAQLRNLVDLTRKSLGITDPLSYATDGQLLESDGTLIIPHAAIMVNSARHQEATDTLNDLIAILTHLHPGLLLKQAVSTTQDHIPVLVHAPGPAETLPACQISAHDIMDAQKLLITLKTQAKSAAQPT